MTMEGLSSKLKMDIVSSYPQLMNTQPSSKVTSNGRIPQNHPPNQIEQTTPCSSCGQVSPPIQKSVSLQTLQKYTRHNYVIGTSYT